jgi:hypothetical protein
MVKFRSMFFKIEELLVSDKIQGLFIYIKNLLIFFFFWHLITCLWFTVSYSEYLDNYESIVSSDRLQDKAVSEQYLEMLYFVFTFSFTVGYGDNHPITTTERLVSIFFTLLSYSVFCYMVGTIRNIMQKSTYIEREMKDKVRNIKKFLKYKHVSVELINKVTNYLEYFYNEREIKKIEPHELFGLLNPKLCDDLRTQLNMKILYNFDFFNLPEIGPLINKLSQMVYEEIINPNEVLIREGETSCSRMYFIEKGSVIMFHQNTTIVFKQLGVIFYNIGK